MEVLPFEILLDILSRIDDPTSLYNLLLASPAASRVFDHDGLQLTRALFTKDNTCDQSWETISLMAMIDSCTLPYPNLDAFVAGFIHDTIRQLRLPRIGEPLSTSRPLPHGLPDNAPVSTIRRVLSIHAQISHLTVACLEHYLEIFNALRPENAADPEVRYSTHPKSTQPWRQRFEGVKAPVSNYGSPTWEEEQRVSRALWRIQSFYDLCTAASQSRLGWPAEDVVRLQGMKARDLFVKWDLQYEAEEIQTVTEYLDYTRATKLVIPYDSYDSSSASKPRRLPWLRHPVEQWWPTRRRPDPHPITQLYEIDYATFGLRQIQLLAEWRASPLRTVKFDSYRRLGFALWCHKRVQAIGLAPLNLNLPGGINLSLWHFAWRSILDPREVEEVETRLQKEWEERELKG
ncbi:uncharacterized protein N7458_002765 [Penicillium daleae]|uniref:F-box domain-containing protein n=1 Tax=Penicillium daleae TaxID=63821 RepID=A0AAD6G7G9_9EURO|nr:uncharacterized protein N7458_002765 [Penicillium daleae]KAJ5461213.1 hypothetical protein N7458_002765 [Penicillium daleae]